MNNDFRKRGKDNSKYTGVGEVTGTYINNIRSAAKKYGKNYNVSNEYLSNLYETQKRKCAFSGIPLTIGNRYLKLETTASLDRINNSKGYIEGNLQWVHKAINKMRGNLTIDEFLTLCTVVSEYSNR